MLIPIADVPRWYADRRQENTIAISHGEETLTWRQLERNANRRARAFAAKGVKPGDFVAIGLPNSNEFFETTFAVWKCGATPTSLSWRCAKFSNILGWSAVNPMGILAIPCRLGSCPKAFLTSH